jgi:DNA-binding beta-propeller fold protein YncE
MRHMVLILSSSLLLASSDCRGSSANAAPGTISTGSSDVRPSRQSGPASSSATHASDRPHLPLVLLSDVDLPGRSTRFDYQDIDTRRGRLVISHMNDSSVVFVKLDDGSVIKELKGIPVARGIAVADDVGLVFVTSSPHELVVIDSASMRETTRVRTGSGPDGVAWDGLDRVVGVSDQRDGALSLISDAGTGTRRQIRLGSETGNVAFDRARGWFWITVVAASAPDRLVAVDARTAAVQEKIDLPGCTGAHGLRLAADGQSAFIACESNATLIRVELAHQRVVGSARTGDGPDVMSIDEGLGWLYVAAESGDMTVFDIAAQGLSLVGHDHPGRHSHSVAVDSRTHRVFLPLVTGPVLRMMRPSGT